MGSEDLAKRRRNERKARFSKEQKIRAETWLIVCEGTKTEPKYFTSLLDFVNTLSEIVASHIDSYTIIIVYLYTYHLDY